MMLYLHYVDIKNIKQSLFDYFFNFLSQKKTKKKKPAKRKTPKKTAPTTSKPKIEEEKKEDPFENMELLYEVRD